MDDMLADLEKSTVSAQNNLTAIFHNFYDEMSDYIDTVRQNRAELAPQDEEGDDSGLMQDLDEGEPDEYDEEEDDSGFVNTDMVQD